MAMNKKRVLAIISKVLFVAVLLAFIAAFGRYGWRHYVTNRKITETLVFEEHLPLTNDGLYTATVWTIDEFDKKGTRWLRRKTGLTIRRHGRLRFTFSEKLVVIAEAEEGNAIVDQGIIKDPREVFSRLNTRQQEDMFKRLLVPAGPSDRRELGAAKELVKVLTGEKLENAPQHIQWTFTLYYLDMTGRMSTGGEKAVVYITAAYQTEIDYFAKRFAAWDIALGDKIEHLFAYRDIEMYADYTLPAGAWQALCRAFWENPMPPEFSFVEDKKFTLLRLALLDFCGQTLGEKTDHLYKVIVDQLGYGYSMWIKRGGETWKTYRYEHVPEDLEFMVFVYIYFELQERAWDLLDRFPKWHDKVVAGLASNPDILPVSDDPLQGVHGRKLNELQRQDAVQSPLAASFFPKWRERPALPDTHIIWVPADSRLYIRTSYDIVGPQFVREVEKGFYSWDGSLDSGGLKVPPARINPTDYHQFWLRQPKAKDFLLWGRVAPPPQYIEMELKKEFQGPTEITH